MARRRSLLRSRPAREAGFTLIETLSVLVIIGLMSAVVVLAIPAPRSALETQSENLARQLNALTQDGIIAGQTVGLGLSPEGYSLYQYDREDWVLVHESAWEERYRLGLRRDGTSLDVPENAVPLFTFSPIGISSNFSLSLSDGDEDFLIQAAGDGRVLWRKDAS